MKSLKTSYVLSLLGTFWSKFFKSFKLLKSIVSGQLSLHAQSEQAIDELLLSTSNIEMPAGKTTVWEKYIFNNYNQAKEVFGNSNSKYGFSYFYGEPSNNVAQYAIPEGILSIPFMYDSISNPTKVLIEGVDYKLSKGLLTFKQTLNALPAIFYAKNVVKESGFVTSRLGYAVGVQLSDEVYRKVPFKHIWRLFSYGQNYFDLINMLGYCANSPISQQDETVEAVFNYPNVCQIITNKSCYMVKPSKIKQDIVVGKLVKKGECFTYGVEILHDKSSSILENIPQNYKSNNTFRYGSKLAKASSLIVIKADIDGTASSALKVLRQVLPLNIKTLIFTNADVPAANAVNANFSFTCSGNSSIKPPSAMIGVNSDSNPKISIKAQGRVKYTSYGY